MLTYLDFPRKPRDDIFQVPQAVEIPGTRRPGQTGHFKSNVFPDVGDFDKHPQLAKTTYEIFRIGLDRNPEAKCLGARPWNKVTSDWEKYYDWLTYSQVDERIRSVGSALMWLESQAQLGPSANSQSWMLGLWFANRPEWPIITYAANAYSLTYTSLYDTLSLDTAQFCINHSDMRVIFTSANHIPDILSIAHACPKLKTIVCIDSFASLDLAHGGLGLGGLEKGKMAQDWAKSVGINIYEMDYILSIGKEHMQPVRLPQMDDMASLCYTSGTTGVPRGAIYTYRSLVNIICAHAQQLDYYDTTLDYLPYSHCYGYLTLVACNMRGTAITYPCGDITRLVEDFQLSKPDFLISVPRVLTRIYSAVKAQTLDAPGIKGAIFRKAYASKLAYVYKTRQNEHPILDSLLFNKVKALIGGRIKFIGVGSAPVAPVVLDFFRVMFSTHVIEGYGTTETIGTVTRCVIGDYDVHGSIGAVHSMTQFKLIDVKEMGYTADDKPYPRGHLCLKGPQVTKGYYKDPEKTKEMFDDEGWMLTGDIALVDDQGRLKIIDRIKSLLKLAQGEYVALEYVENTLSLCSIVQQVLVYGDSLRNHLIAFVVVNPPAFAALCSKTINSGTGGSSSISENDTSKLKELANDERVIQACLKEITSVCKSQKLNGVETPKQIRLLIDPLPSEMITPSMKLKRNVANAYYKEDAERIYNQYNEKVLSKL